VCRRFGIAWKPLLSHQSGLEADLGPSDLLVWGTLKQGELLRNQLFDKSRQCAFLTCPVAAVHVGRVLVINGPGRTDPFYLQFAAKLCRSIGAGMVVLSMADSQRAGERQRLEAQAALLAVDLAIDFDVIAGVNDAVANIVRMRHCQMVIKRRRPQSFWRRWMRREDDTTLDSAATYLQMVLPFALPGSLSSNTRRLRKPASDGRQPVVASSTGESSPPRAVEPARPNEEKQEVAS
jgi:hypothetical protein